MEREQGAVFIASFVQKEEWNYIIKNDCYRVVCEKGKSGIIKTNTELPRHVFWN